MSSCQKTVDFLQVAMVFLCTRWNAVLDSTDYRLRTVGVPTAHWQAWCQVEWSTFCSWRVCSDCHLPLSFRSSLKRPTVVKRDVKFSLLKADTHYRTRKYGPYIRVHFWHPYIRAVCTVSAYPPLLCHLPIVFLGVSSKAQLTVFS